MKQAIDTDGTRIYLIGEVRTDETQQQYIVMEDQWYPITTPEPLPVEPHQILVLEGVWERGKIEVAKPPSPLHPPNSQPSKTLHRISKPTQNSPLSPEQHLSELVNALMNKMCPSPLRCPVCQAPLQMDTNVCVHCSP